MKKRIILFALSVMLIVGMLSAGNAYAWFSNLQGGSQDANRIKSGTIDYELGDSVFVVASDGDVYPAQNLLTGTISLSNDSDITTCLRVKVTYTIGSGSASVWNPNDSDCELEVTLSDDSIWSYNSEDGYLYYDDADDAVAAGQDVDLFDGICLSGSNTDNDVAGQSLSVTVLYEVRQSQYMSSWS